MENVDNKGVIYEFDGFVLDPNERTLTVNGTPTHLPTKEYETLLYLVSHSGRALTKDELMSAIWADAGRMVMVADPSGAGFAIIQFTGPAAE